jgi:SAM-dependent methyltransferase
VFIHDWEAAFAPYDEETYRAVLAQITAHDVVLDIGAGDLRLTRRVATIARRVYAIERDPAVLAQADRGTWPANLIVICADALATAFPVDVTVAVLLMRHCTREHFAAYLQRLSALRRCRRLITNARWKMDVEVIDFRSGGEYDPDQAGWYACRCGSIGFTPGDPAVITPQVLAEVIDVVSCPQCGT